MKSKIIVILALSLSACGKRNDPRLAPPVAPPPAKNPVATTQPSPNQTAAQDQFMKAQELLISMGVKINGKDLIISDEPKTYQEAKDLKLALDSYKSAAQEIINQSQNNEQKQVFLAIAESATYHSTRYGSALQSFYMGDRQRIEIYEGRLASVGFLIKKADNNYSITLNKDFSLHYPRSEQKKELIKYIACIENFLELYIDGQSPLNFYDKTVLEKKLNQAKELAASLN